MSQIGPRDRRQPRHRPRHRARRSSRSGDQVAVTTRSGGRARGRARRPLRHHRPGRRRRGLRRRSRRSTARSRCWSPTPASPRDTLLLRMSRRRLVVGHRHQPHRLVPAGQAGRQGHAAAAPRPDRLHLLGGRAARLGRPGQLRRLARPGWSAWPARWPASSARRSITANVVAPGFVETDMTAVLHRRAEERDQGPGPAAAGTPRRTRSRRRCPGWPPTGAAYVTGAVIPVDGGLGMGH